MADQPLDVFIAGSLETHNREVFVAGAKVTKAVRESITLDYITLHCIILHAFILYYLLLYYIILYYNRLDKIKLD